MICVWNPLCPKFFILLWALFLFSFQLVSFFFLLASIKVPNCVLNIHLSSAPTHPNCLYPSTKHLYYLRLSLFLSFSRKIDLLNTILQHYRVSRSLFRYLFRFVRKKAIRFFYHARFLFFDLFVVRCRSFLCCFMFCVLVHYFFTGGRILSLSVCPNVCPSVYLSIQLSEYVFMFVCVWSPPSCPPSQSGRVWSSHVFLLGFLLLIRKGERERE